MDKTHRTQGESNQQAGHPHNRSDSNCPTCRRREADAWCLCRERGKPDRELAHVRRLTSAPPSRYALFRRSPVALNLAWVASAGDVGDPALLGDLGATCYLAAIDLLDARAASWWEERAPKPSVLYWHLVEQLISPEQHRHELGPGWARRVKGKEVSLQEPRTEGEDATLESVLPTPGPDPQADTVEQDLYARIRDRLTHPEWRAVERRLTGTALTGADRKALCLLRRSPRAAVVRSMLSS